MRLLPRWSRNRANEAALEERVNALQAALDTCKGVAKRWWEFRIATMAAVAALALVAGFVLGVYRAPLIRAAKDTAIAVGLMMPDFEAAQAAYAQGDLASAIALARPAAEAGDARAQALLGLAYARRRAAPPDDLEAATWLRRAAEAGNAGAAFNLALMYEEGRGVPQDGSEADKLYRRAAEQGDPNAQYNLGIRLSQGDGDTIESHMWLNLAAARFPAADTRNRSAAMRARDSVAGRMTAEQIAEAQRRAGAWTPK
jgi:TPR repeat protein